MKHRKVSARRTSALDSVEAQDRVAVGTIGDAAPGARALAVVAAVNLPFPSGQRSARGSPWMGLAEQAATTSARRPRPRRTVDRMRLDSVPEGHGKRPASSRLDEVLSSGIAEVNIVNSSRPIVLARRSRSIEFVPRTRRVRGPARSRSSSRRDRAASSARSSASHAARIMLARRGPGWSTKQRTLLVVAGSSGASRPSSGASAHCSARKGIERHGLRALARRAAAGGRWCRRPGARRVNQVTISSRRDARRWKASSASAGLVTFAVEGVDAPRAEVEARRRTVFGGPSARARSVSFLSVRCLPGGHLQEADVQAIPLFVGRSERLARSIETGGGRR